jgi:hypothetical protein
MVNSYVNVYKSASRKGVNVMEKYGENSVNVMTIKTKKGILTVFLQLFLQFNIV